MMSKSKKVASKGNQFFLRVFPVLRRSLGSRNTNRKSQQLSPFLNGGRATKCIMCFYISFYIGRIKRQCVVEQDAQTDLGFRCLHMSEDTFLHGAALYKR